MPYVTNYSLIIVLLFGLLTLWSLNNSTIFKKVPNNSNYTLESRIELKDLSLNIAISLLLYFSIRFGFKLFAISGLFGDYENYVIVIITIVSSILRLLIKKSIKEQTLTMWEVVLVSLFTLLIALGFLYLPCLSLLTVDYLWTIPIIAELVLYLIESFNRLPLSITSNDSNSIIKKPWGAFATTPSDNQGSSQTSGVWSRIDPFQLFGSGRNAVLREIAVSKDSLEKSDNKIIWFAGQIEHRDADSQKYMETHGRLIERFREKLAQIEGRHTNDGPLTRATLSDVDWKIISVSNDYTELANYRKKLDEARLIMYCEPRTGLVVNKNGMIPWLNREPAVPTHDIIPSKKYSWLSRTIDPRNEGDAVQGVERYLREEASKDVTSKRKRSDSPIEGPSKKK